MVSNGFPTNKYTSPFLATIELLLDVSTWALSFFNDSIFDINGEEVSDKSNEKNKYLLLLIDVA
tara:strand:- start:33405 stop:33596 length:192 start_codon:yes stop_codon:yes gene_type:complete